MPTFNINFSEMSNTIEKLIEMTQKEYDNSMKDFIGYVQDRHELFVNGKKPTKQEARNMLQECSVEWDFENLARESGYLAWVNQVLNYIKMMRKK